MKNKDEDDVERRLPVEERVRRVNVEDEDESSSENFRELRGEYSLFFFVHLVKAEL